ncbi:MAG: bifunctional 2-polyprenyl-6-hydroxyphenol methylase/3-demethylubiquinol 3-O-methyltransferase UbiG [Anaerolineales bacterium]
MTKSSNASDKEINKFEAVSEIWWDPGGKMGTLHTINPLRMKFILESLNLYNAKILDVGCGGGILSEALAKAGAQVTGMDLSRASLEAARRHAKEQGLQIDYRYENLEEVAQAQMGAFDGITCMEMLEHVPEPERILAACAQVLKPGGHFFCSTINRTPKAFLFAIIGGEFILRLLPRGSHTYGQLIRPRELKRWAQESGLEFVKISSLMYNLFTRKFTVVEGKEDVNYMAHFIKK